MNYISEKYLASDSAERQSMVLRLIQTNHFDPALIRLIAEEPPLFISAIAMPLFQSYRCFFDYLLCDVATQQGLDGVKIILDQTDFVNQIPPIDLAKIDTHYASDNNPLHVFYRRHGSDAFISLYESGAIKLRQIYLWVRTQNAQPNSDHEQFILALARHYVHDFAKAPPAITECFVTECDIAAARGSVYYLEDHLPLLGQLLDQLGVDGFCDFLTYFIAKLRCRPAHEAAENLLYCKFLCYASIAHLPISNRETLCPQFWAWLLDHASEMADLRDFLLLPATDDHPRP